MIFAHTLYFSEEILKSQHRKLKDQLLIGEFTEKNNYWVIVMKEQGANLFECISVEEYTRLFARGEEIIVTGVLHDATYFPIYVTQMIELLIQHNREITKKNIQELLRGELDEQRN